LSEITGKENKKSQHDVGFFSGEISFSFAWSDNLQNLIRRCKSSQIQNVKIFSINLVLTLAKIQN